MRCRGQVTPASSPQLVYEIFVAEVRAGPMPTVFADLLCTVDGLKAFHARRVGLRLVPDWPLEHWRAARPARDAIDRRARAAARARRAGRPRRAEAGRVRRRLLLRPRVAARLRVGPALGGLRPDVPRLRRHAPRRAPAGAALPLHVARHADRRGDGRHAAGRQRRGRVRRARGRVVLRRRTAPPRCRSACSSRPRSSRAAGSPRFVGSALSTETDLALPQPRRHRARCSRRSSPAAARCARGCGSRRSRRRRG